jgi:hypothetical protein
LQKLSSAIEKEDTSATYPYGAMSFIPALAIISELPTTVKGGAESLKGSQSLEDGRSF